MKVSRAIQWALQQQRDKDMRAMGVCPGMWIGSYPICIEPAEHDGPHTNFDPTDPSRDRTVEIHVGREPS